jgi:hypothetical protein
MNQMKKKTNIFPKPWSSKTLKFPMFYEVQLNPVHIMKAYGERAGESSLILNVVTNWRSAISFTHCWFIPRARAPEPHWTRGYIYPRACLDTVMNEKSLDPTCNWTPIPQSSGQYCYHFFLLNLPCISFTLKTEWTSSCFAGRTSGNIWHVDF